MEDFDIEIIPKNADEKKPVQLPLNFLTIGEVENDDVKVYIKQDVYKELEKYAASDTDHELGTILLGDYSEEMGKMHVIISDFIYAKYTDASASTLTFTHETWEYIHKEHDEKHSDKRIVGWQHTHPGYGIFLSNYDMFIQENFFNVPFQVAYVIDPVQHLRGFFQWKNNKVEKLNGFYIYDEIGEKIKIEEPKVKNIEVLADDSKTNQKQKLIQPIAIGCLALLSICLLFTVNSLSKKYAGQVEKQRRLEEQIEDQRILIAEQSDELSAVKESLSQIDSKNNENNDTTETATDEGTQPIDEELNSQDVDVVLDNEEETFEFDEETGLVTFLAYTVKGGDSLSAICREHGLDYGAMNRVILSMNGIDDPNQIYIGQTILLPIRK